MHKYKLTYVFGVVFFFLLYFGLTLKVTVFTWTHREKPEKEKRWLKAKQTGDHSALIVYFIIGDLC